MPVNSNPNEELSYKEWVNNDACFNSEMESILSDQIALNYNHGVNLIYLRGLRAIDNLRFVYAKVTHDNEAMVHHGIVNVNQPAIDHQWREDVLKDRQYYQYLPHDVRQAVHLPKITPDTELGNSQLWQAYYQINWNELEIPNMLLSALQKWYEHVNKDIDSRNEMHREIIKLNAVSPLDWVRYANLDHQRHLFVVADISDDHYQRYTVCCRASVKGLFRNMVFKVPKSWAIKLFK